MKLLLSIYVLTACFSAASQDTLTATKKIVLNGLYQGKSLYLQNPYREEGLGFCVKKVTVNGMKLCEHKGSAYEIGFWCYKNLAVGQEVEIVIEHYADCTPKILNSNNVSPRSTFILIDYDVDTSGVLTWTTREEDGRLMYSIEQFRWNKWVKIDEVEGLGTSDTNTYTTNVRSWFHAGENQFRIKQVGYSGRPRVSPTIFVKSSVPVVVCGPRKSMTFLNFSDSTHYEIYDAYGNQVEKGYAIKVDVRELKKGAYYLNYDNKNEKFIKP